MSINWVNVFTLVAASSAVIAIDAISLACSSVKPCCMSSASVYTPANCLSVSVRTSDVSHAPLDNDSLKLPYVSIASFAPVPNNSEVLIRAS